MIETTKNRWKVLPRALVAAVALGAATVVLAQTLRLPPKYIFPRGKESPGPVTFSHGSHVDSKKPDCTVCHPRLFKILEPGVPAEGGPVTHEAMKRGRQCGACHDEEKTFGLDDCSSCHEKP